MLREKRVRDFFAFEGQTWQRAKRREKKQLFESKKEAKNKKQKEEKKEKRDTKRIFFQRHKCFLLFLHFSL